MTDKEKGNGGSKPGRSESYKEGMGQSWILVSRVVLPNVCIR